MRIKEDNTATIKVMRKGYSPKLRHVQWTHKVNLGSIKVQSEFFVEMFETLQSLRECMFVLWL